MKTVSPSDYQHIITNLTRQRDVARKERDELLTLLQTIVEAEKHGRLNNYGPSFSDVSLGNLSSVVHNTIAQYLAKVSHHG